MPETERFDMLVLGSGEGGKYLAWHMARLGQRVAVVERKLIGGSCPNTNCLPSKNESRSAKVADLVHHADRFGSAPAATGTDIKRVLARKREMVDGLIGMHRELYKASGAHLIMYSRPTRQAARDARPMASSPRYRRRCRSEQAGTRRPCRPE
jgi:pyruvate/2-oxoglutarate dehydrogenase complex dihydrolipoamide dehydrogenase (E3) component